VIRRGDDRLAMRELGSADPVFDGAAVDRAARTLANEDAVAAAGHVEALVTIAVQNRRLDEVVFWQRVMFKSRLIRARRGVSPPGGWAPGGRPC